MNSINILFGVDISSLCYDDPAVDIAQSAIWLMLKRQDPDVDKLLTYLEEQKVNDAVELLEGKNPGDEEHVRGAVQILIEHQIGWAVRNAKVRLTLSPSTTERQVRKQFEDCCQANQRMAELYRRRLKEGDAWKEDLDYSTAIATEHATEKIMKVLTLGGGLSVGI